MNDWASHDDLPSVRRSAGGFTLIELLISVGLLIMIILISSFIFDSTIKAVGNSQASSEMMLSLESCADTIRQDLCGFEHDGYLIIGARRQMAYGSAKDRANNTKRAYRNDWLMGFTSNEQYSTFDPRLIGQWSRIFYGQAQVADPQSANYSTVAVDWVLMRHQIILLPRVTVSGIETTNQGAYASYGTYEGFEGGQYAGASNEGRHQYTRVINSHSRRDLRWYWYMNWAWEGDVLTPTYDLSASGGSTIYGKAYFEPTYWQTALFYSGGGYSSNNQNRRFHLLPNCAEFAVQFAFAEDLKSGGDDVIKWRDPPFYGVAGYNDPNYKADRPDPLHNNPTIPADTSDVESAVAPGKFVKNNPDTGRLVFGPGDRWPVLLRITVHVFDPLDRIDGGRRMSLVIPVP